MPYPTVMPPRSVQKDELSTASDTAKVLGKNLSALMAATLDLSSNPKVAKRTGLSTSTIHRLRNGDVDATLSTLEALSKAFDLEPWQLLVVNFDPRNRPVLQPLTELERRLYARLAEVAKEIKEGG